MSIYNEKKSNSNPFKTVTVEYFEDFESDDKKVTPTWSNRPRRRQIRVVTTTRRYNLGSTKGDPIVSVTYEYLQGIIMINLKYSKDVVKDYYKLTYGRKNYIEKRANKKGISVVLYLKEKYIK